MDADNDTTCRDLLVALLPADYLPLDDVLRVYVPCVLEDGGSLSSGSMRPDSDCTTFSTDPALDTLLRFLKSRFLKFARTRPAARAAGSSGEPLRIYIMMRSETSDAIALPKQHSGSDPLNKKRHYNAVLDWLGSNNAGWEAHFVSGALSHPTIRLEFDLKTLGHKADISNIAEASAHYFHGAMIGNGKWTREGSGPAVLVKLRALNTAISEYKRRLRHQRKSALERASLAVFTNAHCRKLARLGLRPCHQACRQREACCLPENLDVDRLIHIVGIYTPLDISSNFTGTMDKYSRYIFRPRVVCISSCIYNERTRVLVVVSRHRYTYVKAL